MQTYEQHIAELKHSPQLPKAIEDLNAFWQDEQRRRLQFYNNIDEDTKAEFIEGEIVMHSPAKNVHNVTCGFIERIFSTYVDVRGLGLVVSEKALVSLARNDFEPDVSYWNIGKAAGITAQTLKYPAPDWVCEVLSPGTARYDRGIKMKDYAANAISEYWIIDPELLIAEIYLLEAGEYVLRIKTDSGILRCQSVLGLEFPIEAIFDAGENIKALRSILQ